MPRFCRGPGAAYGLGPALAALQVEVIRDSIAKVAFQFLYDLVQSRVVDPSLRIAFYVVPRRLGVDRRIEVEVVKTAANGKRCREDRPKGECNRTCDHEKHDRGSLKKSPVHSIGVPVAAQISILVHRGTVKLTRRGRADPSMTRFGTVKLTRRERTDPPMAHSDHCSVRAGHRIPDAKRSRSQ